MNRHHIFFIIISLFFASCSRNKAVETTTISTQTEVDSVYNLMNSHQFNAEWFSGKFKGSYNNPNDKQVFNGQIRIRKDSLIWVSITAMMNIEVFRLEVKPDSFTFINKLEKTYVKSSTEFLRERIGVDLDFEMLQSALLGNDFPYYETSAFKLNNKYNKYQLSTISRRKLKKQSMEYEDNSKILVQNILIDKQTYKIDEQTVKVAGNDKTVLRINYNNFQLVNNQLFPHNMIIKYKEDNKTFIELNYNKITIDKKLRFPFKVTKKYMEVKIEDR